MARTRKTGPKPSQELAEPDVDTAEADAQRSDEAIEQGIAPEHPSKTVREPVETPEETHSDQPAEADTIADIALSEPEASEASVPPEAERTNPEPVAKVNRRGGAVPLLLGGIVAGVIGFGSAAYVIPRYLPSFGSSDVVSSLDNLVKEQSDKLVALDRAVADLRSALKTATSSPSIAEELSGQIAEIGPQLDALTKTVAGIDERVGALDSRLTEAERQPLTGDAASASALEAFREEMDGFRAEIAAQEQAVEAAKGDIAKAAKAATTTIESVKADAEKLTKEAAVAEQRAAVSGGISQIKAALDSGAAIDGPISQLKAAGVEVPAALADQAQGVPTFAALRESFPEAARNALAVSVPEVAGSDAWSRITAFFQSQSGARSLTPRAGDDPDAVLSRAEANLRAGDLAKTIEELKLLPDPGKAAMSEWTSRAERRTQAVAAASTLEKQVE